MVLLLAYVKDKGTWCHSPNVADIANQSQLLHPECGLTTLLCGRLQAGTADGFRLRFEKKVVAYWNCGKVELALVWESRSLSSNPTSCANLLVISCRLYLTLGLSSVIHK